MYYGRNYSPSIRDVLTNIFTNVSLSSRRTFAPETAVFFSMWWRDASVAQRALVQRLVAGGRVEWVGAGWVQHDEGITRAETQIDQMTLGHLYLQSTVRQQRVSAAWQADPFGHSAGAAYIFARHSFDGLSASHSSVVSTFLRRETGVRRGSRREQRCRRRTRRRHSR